MSTAEFSKHNTNTNTGETGAGHATEFTGTFTGTGTGTGTWADSAHSVIWMSRDSKSQVLPYLHRPRASQYALSLIHI